MDHKAPADIAISVLGHVEARTDDGQVVDLGTPRMRAIMAALALAEGRPVSFGSLVDRVWGAAAPATAVGTLQRYVASLRRALEPGRAPEQAPSVLVTTGQAYTLVVPSGARDVDRFDAAVAEARRVLAGVPDPLRPSVPAAQVAAVGGAVDVLDSALRLWRGEPYADLGDHDAQVGAERARLHDLRVSAVELRLIALLALGRHLETLGDLERLTSLHPLHERWWALRAVALVRSGRQAAALEVLGQVRTLLADELGVDPSPPLQQLYSDILRQDPSLAWNAEPSASGDAEPRRPQRHRSQPAPARPRWPLTGRAAERAALTSLVGNARDGHFGAGLITGEAGVGKTRLVQEVLAEAYAAGTAIAVGRCSERAPALWPLRTAVESLGPELSPDDLELLATRPDDFRTWQALVGCLRRATAEGPVLLVVEDVQWADTATIQVLEHLVSDHDLAGLALLVVRRTHEGEDLYLSRLAAAIARSAGLRVDLTALPAAEARELALTVDPDLADVEGVVRRSGGNPFFVAELALAGGRVAGGLVDVVRTRLSSLGESTRSTLGLASVADRFDLDVLAELLGTASDDVETVLEPALRAGIVRRVAGASPHYRFEHDVVRDVLSEEGSAQKPYVSRSPRSQLRTGGSPQASMISIARSA